MGMNRRYCFLIGFTFLFFQLSLNGQEAFFQDFRLGNSLRVVVIPDTTASTITGQVYIDYPVKGEGRLAGLGKFAMALKVKMAEKEFPKLAAYPNLDQRSLIVTTAKENIEPLLAFFQKVFSNSEFDATLLEQQKGEWIQDLTEKAHNAQAVADRVGKVLRFSGHPYAEIPTVQSIGNIQLADCVAFWQKNIQANLAYLALSGNVEMAAAKTLSEKYLEHWLAKPVYKSRLPLLQYPLESATHLVLLSNADHFSWQLTYPFYLRRSNKATPPAMVAVELLRLKLEEQLKANGVFTAPLEMEILPDRHFGYFRVSYTSPQVDQVLAVANWTREAIGNLPQWATDETLLQRAKDRLKAQYEVALTNREILTTFALQTLRYKLDQDYYPSMPQRIESVDATAVQAVLPQFIYTDPVHMVLVGNEETLQQKTVHEKLAGKIKYADPQGNIQEKALALSLEELDASAILRRYLSAIGGENKLADIRDFIWFSQADLGDDVFETAIKKKVGGKMNMSVKKNGSLQTQIKFDGQRGGIWNNGTAVKIEGDLLNNLSLQSPLFPERIFLDSLYQKEKIGEGEINGIPVFQVRVANPAGAKVDLFFDINTGLKIGQSQSNGPGGAVTQTYFEDYRPVNGILFPWKMTTVVGQTTGLSFTTTHILLNQRLADSVFSIR